MLIIEKIKEIEMCKINTVLLISTSILVINLSVSAFRYIVIRLQVLLYNLL